MYSSSSFFPAFAFSVSISSMFDILEVKIVIGTIIYLVRNNKKARFTRNIK